MFTRSGIGAALVLSLLAPAALSAQSTSQQRNVILFANGGGVSPVTDLNDAGTASLKTGWAAGGGVGVQINPYVAVRGTFDLTQTEGEGSAAGALGSGDLRHYFYGGDVQLRYPTTSGFAPYLLLGAGAVTIDNADDDTFQSFTKFAGKGGLGVEYVFPQNNLGLFAQATSYIYDYDRTGFDKTQADLLWTAGLSYRLPF
jgi:Outer membrane protein beta-barrel domain